MPDKYLRDFFAGLVLHAEYTACIATNMSFSLIDLAEEAYKVADAMMEARKVDHEPAY